MKIFSASQTRIIDAYTIENEPVSSIDLMERACKQLLLWIKENFGKQTSFVFFAGPGNNGGDAWGLARLMANAGYSSVKLYLLKISDTISPDSQINRNRLKEQTDVRVMEINSENNFPEIHPDDWLVDGLFGSGLSRPLEGIAASLVKYFNKSVKSGVISIDIPSGLYGENNSNNTSDAIVKATHTLSFQFPKLSFLFSENENYIGKWEMLPINLHEKIINEEKTSWYYFDIHEAKGLVKSRKKFSHKGTYGHALLIAGSYGMMGAAVLAGKAAVAGGAGLVTMHIPRMGYEIIQISIPEALTSIDESDLMFTEIGKTDSFTAIGIGPGINKKVNTAKALKELLEKIEVPLVIDADGINILSENKDWFGLLPKGSVLTPHPKEFDRLTKSHISHSDRFQSQIKFSVKFGVYVVLKGANTSISTPEGEVWFNSTGNPGMAKGGCGDVLTGIIVSLLAQGYSSCDAARLGVFVHGLAGDIALKRKGYHALLPSDIIKKLGNAFKKIEN